MDCLLRLITLLSLLAAAPHVYAQDAKSKDAKEQSRANLKRIGAAFNKYEEANGHFPIGLIDPKADCLGISWRVQILPYLDDPEAAKLYKKFRLDEPWDSETNKKLLTSMPKVFAAVRGNAPAGHTYYQGFADHVLAPKGEKWPMPIPWAAPGAFFPDPRSHVKVDRIVNGALPNPARKANRIADGTSNTFLVAEAGAPAPWTKPEDIEFRRSVEKPFEGYWPKLGGLFDGDFHVLMVDGVVHFIKKGVAASKLRPFVTFAGGEDLDHFSIGLEPPDWAEIKPFVGVWLRTAFEENGKKQPFNEQLKYKLIFTKERKVAYMQNDAAIFNGEFFVLDDAKEKIKRVRWDWKGGITDRVIYSFEGPDKLIACWTHTREEWPMRFATGVKDGGTYLAVWQRVAK